MSSALPSAPTRDDKPAHSSALATSPTYHRPSHAIETRARQSAPDSAHPLDDLRRGGAALRSSLRSSTTKPGALLLGTTNGTQGCSEPCKTANGNQARVGRQTTSDGRTSASARELLGSRHKPDHQARGQPPRVQRFLVRQRIHDSPMATTATRPSFHTNHLRRASSKGGLHSRMGHRVWGVIPGSACRPPPSVYFFFSYPLGTGCKGVLFHLEHPGGLGPDGACVCAHSHTLWRALDGHSWLGLRQRQRGGCSGDDDRNHGSLGVSSVVSLYLAELPFTYQLALLYSSARIVRSPQRRRRA